MKFSSPVVTTLFLFVVVVLERALAGVSPELSITVKDGSFDNIPSALTPQVSVTGDVAGVDMGMEMDVVTGFVNVGAAPKSLWASKSTDLAGGAWTLKARAEYSEHKYDYPNEGARGVYVSLEANNADESTFCWMSGDASLAGGVQPLKIGGKKVVAVGHAGKVMVEPRYGFAHGGPDLCLGYERPDGDTRVYLTASANDQNVKIVQNLKDDVTASVKYGAQSGFGYLKVENTGNTNLGKSTLTVTKDQLDVELEKDGWKAGIAMGYPLQSAEPQVRFSKSFSVGGDAVM